MTYIGCKKDERDFEILREQECIICKKTKHIDEFAKDSLTRYKKICLKCMTCNNYEDYIIKKYSVEK